ncbi:MAG: cell division protein FtsQ/DivIB [Hyphomicrobiales bacterium]
MLDGAGRLMRPLGSIGAKRFRPVHAPLHHPAGLDVGDRVSTLQRANATIDRRFGFIKGWFASQLMRIFSLAFIGAAIVYGLILDDDFAARGGALKTLIDEESAMIGMAAKTIRVTGLHLGRRGDVLAAIGLEPGQTLIGFEVARARDALLRLDWVDSASVRILFPNQLHIAIRERIAYALWQNNGRFHVIDSSGTVITTLEAERFPTLPVVVGKRANRKAFALVNQLEGRAALRSRLRAAVWVAERHWTLYLNTGIRVILPHEGVSEALDRLMMLENRHALMERDILSVDLRMPGRATVRLSPQAAQR